MQTVKIVSTGGSALGTKVFDIASGVEFSCIERIVIDPIVSGELLRAELRLFVAEFEIEAVPRWSVLDPVTGEPRQISRIVFADGGEFVPD